VTKGFDAEALTEQTLAAFDILKAVMNRLVRTELKYRAGSKVMDQNIASWNRISSWLRQLKSLQAA